MPDVPVEQTNPADAGHTTTEWTITKVVTIVGAILAGLLVLFTQLHDALPTAGWIATAISILTVLATVAGTVMKYIGGRADVKVALANLEAAKTVSGARLVGAGSTESP